MSEFQHYELQTIDRPLTEDEQAEIDKLWRRAALASTQAVFAYQFGHFPARMEIVLNQHSQFTPVLRFILADAEERTFAVERMGYSSSMHGWPDIHASGKIDPLAGEWIPKLGTDGFFDLFR